jgi:hypothetical protein
LLDPVVDEAIEERRRKDIKIALFLALSGMMRLPHHTTMIKGYLSSTYSWFSLASVEHDSPKYDKKIANLNMRTQRTFDTAAIELNALPYINGAIRKKIDQFKSKMVVINTEDQVVQLESDHFLSKYTTRTIDSTDVDAVIIEELNKF